MSYGQHRPRAINELKAALRQEIATVSQEMTRRGLYVHFTQRLQLNVENGGLRLDNKIFITK